MRILAIAITSFALAVPAFARQDRLVLDTTDVSIIPAPQEFGWGIGIFRIPASTRIVVGSGLGADDAFAAECLNNELESLGHDRLRVVKEEEIRKFPSGAVYLASPGSVHARKLLSQRAGLFSSAMKEEGYVLEVTPEGIVIIAETAAGRFYGVMSLVQAIRGQKRSAYVPAMTIRDWPLQAMRGISDDISRGQISSMDNFRKIIRSCARYKLNVYGLYLEDVFRFSAFPRDAARNALLASEVQELDAYAKRFHVQLIPIFETLGHWENFFLYSDLSSFAEFPGAHTLNVSDKRVYVVLFQMLQELSAAFSSPYFHFGADESWDVGRGASKERVAASGIAEVHAEHYRILFDMLARLKRKPMMYGDVLLNNPEILSKIPKDVIIVDWHYGAADSYPSAAILRAAGLPFIVSPAVWNFTGPFPNYLNAFVNIRNFVRDGYREGALGVLTSNWNDNGGEALRELNYLGYAWTAECAWQPLRADGGGFAHRFFRDFFGSEEAATFAEGAYAILGDPANQTTWYDLWRHPMLPTRSNGIGAPVRSFSAASTMPAVDRLIANGRAASTRNVDHWEYLSFVSRLIAWNGLRLSTADRIRGMTQNPPLGADRDSITREARALCTPVLSGLRHLRENFLKVWHSAYRDGGFDLLLGRYARQELYWMEKAGELDRGILWTDPTISSRWIYHPSGHPGNRDSTAAQVRRAFFRTAVEAPARFRSARVQLLGDTHARLFLNGEEVAEVMARRSLSLRVESQRARIVDITAQLKPGPNVIAVESENVDDGGSAGVNVYGEIMGIDSTVTVMRSDSTWSVTDVKPAIWPSVDPVPSAGDVAVRVFPYPFLVTRPDLWRERTSWFER